MYVRGWNIQNQPLGLGLVPSVSDMTQHMGEELAWACKLITICQKGRVRSCAGAFHCARDGSPGKESASGLGHTHTLTLPEWGWGVVWRLYLWCNAVRQGALWYTGDREWGDVQGDTLGACGLFSLRKATQDVDRVSPYKCLRLPRPATQIKAGG